MIKEIRELINGRLQGLRVGRLMAELDTISSKIRYRWSGKKISNIQLEIGSYHLFNRSESNFNYFLMITGGKYAEEYAEIENICCKMNSVEECWLISEKCAKLSKKIGEDNPKYVHGFLLDIGMGTYVSWCSLGVYVIAVMTYCYLSYWLK